MFSERLRVYAAGGYYEEGKGIKELVKEMESYVAEGFRAVKMKIGGESMEVDVERVRSTGFRLYTGRDSRTYAINWGQGRAYYWRS